MPENIQALFGQEVMATIRRFALRDEDDVATLASGKFSHVGDAALRQAVAQTYFGARWLYRLGLGTLAAGDERAAHIRSQVIDYGSICEALLFDMVRHGIFRKVFAGAMFKLKNPWNGTGPIVWPATSHGIASLLQKRSFQWLIKIAEDEGVISSALATRLSGLRSHRNTVHITAKVSAGVNYYLGLARRGRHVMNDTVDETKAWKALHP